MIALGSTEELLGYMLRWAMGSPMPTNHHIIEKHLYGEKADPSRVLGDVDDSHWDVSVGKGLRKQVKSSVHVITKLTRVKTRISRRAGCGWWSGQASAKNILNESGQLIGSRKMFTFEKGSDATAEDDHHWIMNEYSLADTYVNNYELKHHDYMICRITRTLKYQQLGDYENKSGTKRLSCKKRVLKSEDVTASCYKTLEAHQDEVAQMLADSSVSSPGSVGFGELTQEDLEILNSILI